MVAVAVVVVVVLAAGAVEAAAVPAAVDGAADEGFDIPLLAAFASAGSTAPRRGTTSAVDMIAFFPRGHSGVAG